MLISLSQPLKTGLSADSSDLKTNAPALVGTNRRPAERRTQVSHLCGSGERHFIDIHVPDDCSPSRGSHSRQDIHNPFWETHLKEKVGSSSGRYNIFELTFSAVQTGPFVDVEEY